MSTERLQPVAILWDIENCVIPQDVNAEDVAVHIRLALKLQLALKGPITVFSAYGDFSHLPRHTRQGCHKTGVNLIDIPHGKKDAADKAILVDMFLFALDNPPPCTVVLISGDVDFAPALHKLGQRGYCVVLAIPLGREVSPALCSACQYLWIWPDVARGKGLNLVKTPSLCMIDQAEGNRPVEGNHHGFNNLEAGPSGNQNGGENSRKIPVGMFEECVKVPFDFAKESVFTTSNDITSYDNAPLTSQSLNGGALPSGQYVCDQFAGPYPQSANTGKQTGGACTKQTLASKEAVHVQSQGAPLQLKVKKMKLKKTKDNCQVQEAPQLSKKQRKAARLAVLQAQNQVERWFMYKAKVAAEGKEKEAKKDKT